MTDTTERSPIWSRTNAGLARLAGPWWLFLVTGIAWLLIAWIALRFTPASVATVGALLGVLFLFALIDEIVIASVHARWRWLHIALAVVYLFGMCWAFAQPFDAFWTLASILGLLLIIRGTMDLVMSIETRDVNRAWWLGLTAGILEILLGFWAAQQYRAVQGALLLIWVGFFALFRGITAFVLAFELRHAQHP